MAHRSKKSRRKPVESQAPEGLIDWVAILAALVGSLFGLSPSAGLGAIVHAIRRVQDVIVALRALPTALPLEAAVEQAKRAGEEARAQALAALPAARTRALAAIAAYEAAAEEEDAADAQWAVERREEETRQAEIFRRLMAGVVVDGGDLDTPLAFESPDYVREARMARVRAEGEVDAAMAEVDKLTRASRARAKLPRRDPRTLETREIAAAILSQGRFRRLRIPLGSGREGLEAAAEDIRRRLFQAETARRRELAAARDALWRSTTTTEVLACEARIARVLAGEDAEAGVFQDALARVERSSPSARLDRQAIERAEAAARTLGCEEEHHLRVGLRAFQGTTPIDRGDNIVPRSVGAPIRRRTFKV